MTNVNKNIDGFRPGSKHRIYQVKRVIGRTMDGFGGSTVGTWYTDTEANVLKVKKLFGIGTYEESSMSIDVFVGDDGNIYDSCFRKVTRPENVFTSQALEDVASILSKITKVLTPAELNFCRANGILVNDSRPST